MPDGRHHEKAGWFGADDRGLVRCTDMNHGLYELRQE